MSRQVVYIGHDNPVNVILKENNSAVNLATSTAMTLTLGTVLVSSTNGSTHAIRWNLAGYETGEVRISIGSDTRLTVGDYDAPLITYGPDYTNGLVWGEIGIRIRAECEAS